MTWTKLDDRFLSHPKFGKVSDAAQLLYVRGLIYSNCHNTDGRIESSDVDLFATKTILRNANGTVGLAAELVAANLWEPHPDDGWIIHNFLKHNPSREEVEAKRAETSAKRSEAGKRGNEVRWGADRKIANESQGVSHPGRTGAARCEPDPSKVVVTATARQRSPRENKGRAAGIAKSQNDRPVPSRPDLSNHQKRTLFVRSPSPGASTVDAMDETHVTPHAPTPDAASERMPPPAYPSDTAPHGDAVKEPARTDAPPLTSGAPSVDPKTGQRVMEFASDVPAPQTPSKPIAPIPPMPAVNVPTPKPRKREKAPANTASTDDDAPMPFTVAVALAALSAAAKGTFIVGHREDWHRGTMGNVTRMIRRFPDLARWTLVGEHLAATLGPRERPKTANWAGSAECANAMIESRDWNEGGRPTAARNGYANVVLKAQDGPLPVAPKSAWADVPPEGTRTGRRLFG